MSGSSHRAIQINRSGRLLAAGVALSSMRGGPAFRSVWELISKAWTSRSTHFLWSELLPKTQEWLKTPTPREFFSHWSRDCAACGEFSTLTVFWSPWYCCNWFRGWSCPWNWMGWVYGCCFKEFVGFLIVFCFTFLTSPYCQIMIVVSFCSKLPDHLQPSWSDSAKCFPWVSF